MNAIEAHRLTRKNIQTTVITPYLEHIYKRIKENAEKGLSTLTHPFMGYSGKLPDQDAENEVFRTLRRNGYTVRHVPNPDPGHPCSCDYDEISWNKPGF